MSDVLTKQFGKNVEVVVNPVNNQAGTITLQLDVGNSSTINLTQALASVAAGTSTNVPSTIVVRDGNGNFVGQTVTCDQLVDNGLTVNTAIYADSSKRLTSSTVNPTELGYLSGVTSSLQTQINGKQASGTYVTNVTGSGNIASSGGTTPNITLTGTVAIGSGGTGQVTQQASIDALTGSQSSGKYLRSDGTHATLTSVQAGDIPTLNQNTSGSAAKWTTARNLAGNSVDGSANVPFSNSFICGGTSDSGLSSAQFTGSLGTGIVKNTTSTGALSIAVAGDFPTLNQNTTGTSSNVTGTVAIAKGGTGQTSKASAFDALQPMTTGGDIIYGGASGTGTRLANGSSGQVLTSNGSTSAPSWQTAGGGSGVTGSYVSSYFGVASTWSTTSTSFADGTNSGGNSLTVRQNSGITLTAGASNICGVTFTPPVSSAVYLVTVNTSVNESLAGNGLCIQLTDGTTIISSPPQIDAFVGSPTFPTSIVACGVYAAGTTSPVTIKLQLAVVGAGTATIQGQGATAQSSVEWTIVRIV